MSSPLSVPAERWNNRALFKLVWPLVIEQLLAVAMGMMDTVMVASVGEAAVSGVSLVDSVNVLLINIFAAFATGGAVVVSQYIGNRQNKQASDAARQLFYGISAISLLIMLVSLVFRRGLLQLIFGNISPDVMQASETYFWVSAISYPFLAVYNAGAALFRSMGNSRVSMFISLLVNLLDVGANALFIYGFSWGVFGAAFSTFLSRVIAAVGIVWLLYRGSGHQPVSLKGLFRFKINFSLIRSILKIGVPNGMENSMFQIGKLLVARIVAQLGTAAIAGNAIAIAVATFANLPGAAISLALLTVVGQCVGGADYAGARRYTRKLMVVAFAAMAVTELGLLAASGPLLGLFGLSKEATEIAALCVTTHCILAVFLWPQSFSLPSALRAAGDVRFTMLVSIFSMWTFRIGLAYLFAIPMGLGVWGVWLAMTVDWAVRGTIFLWRWHNGRWQSKRLV